MTQPTPRFTWIPLIVALSLSAGIYLGVYLFGGEAPAGTSKVDDLIRIIGDQYVDTVETNELIESALPKIVGELDPHSVYIPARELEETNEELEGSFSGIGIQFNMLTDTVTVVGVIPGGPSEKAGILPGDRIVTINDTTFVGKKVSTTDIMKRLRGIKGTPVKVGVMRNSANELLPFTIVRGDIPLNSVDAAFLLDGGEGYIKISKFGRTTYDEFLQALGKLKQEGATGYIVDLRGNGGGYMDAATAMVNEFLPKGELIVYAEGKALPRNDVKSNGKGVFQQTPIVVLTDEFSASASEIFAGAIQDNDRGTIIGRRSFGKGLVQRQIPFDDGSAVRLTIARYYTPSGRSIQKEYHLGESETYEQELTNRYMHGEFDSQDSIKPIDSLRYETRNGRTVYGGGGIMPDIFVPRDTTGITSYYIAVVNSGILYQFAFDYVDRNRELLKEQGDLDGLVRYLDSRPLLDEFTAFAHAKGVKRRPYYIAQSKELLLSQLYAYIARNALDEESFYKLFFRRDPTVTKAVEVLQTNRSFPQPPAHE